MNGEQQAQQVAKPVDKNEAAWARATKQNEREKKQVGANVKHWRGERGWTVRELADRAGMSIAYVFMVEGGQREMSGKYLHRMANALRVSPATLRAFPEKMPF